MQEELFYFLLKIYFAKNFAKNSVILGADMNSFVHGNNKTKDILILDEGLT